MSPAHGVIRREQLPLHQKVGSSVDGGPVPCWCGKIIPWADGMFQRCLAERLGVRIASRYCMDLHAQLNLSCDWSGGECRC